MEVVFTEYLSYRAKLRDFDLKIIEMLSRHSTEKYIDLETGRRIAVGKHNDILVMIPYEIKNETAIPVTIHATTRQQIKFRLKTGRFNYE